MESFTLGSERVKGRRTHRCRLCMKNAEKYLSLFVSNEAFRMSIGQAIEDLLIIQVAEDDGLPGTACRSCVRKLIEFRDFKEMVVHSATELRKYTLDIAITSPVKDEASHVLLMDEGKVINCSNRVLNESSGMTILSDTRDPLALENVVDEKEVSAVEPHAGQEGSEEESLLEKEYCGRQLVYIESAPLEYGNECRIKEEAVPMEPIASVEFDRREDIDEEDFLANTVSNMDSDPLDVGQMVPDVHNIGEHGNYYRKITSGENELRFDRQGIPPRKDLRDYFTSSPASTGEDDKMKMMCTSEGEIYRSQECRNASSPFNGRQGRLELNTASLESTCEDNDPFKSSSCEDALRIQSALANDSKTHSKVKAFACNTCGQGFDGVEQLRTHINSHAGMKPFLCDASGEGFANLDNLKRHSLGHSGEKPFKCQRCGKGFTLKAALRRHENAHLAIKPFQCSTCGKCFAIRSLLKNHSLVHGGLKPHRCHICGKGFLEKRCLQGHVNSHMGIKPFQCETCGIAFARKSNLMNHSLVHSSVHPFKCRTCGKEFKRRNALYVHEKGVHSRFD